MSLGDPVVFLVPFLRSLKTYAALVSLIIGFLYFALLEGYYGQTVGKMAVKIKVVREADGGLIDFSQAAVRTGCG